jgi:hypothetical protein
MKIQHLQVGIWQNDEITIAGVWAAVLLGKGLVQRRNGFGDGSAVRLTITWYYTNQPFHSKSYENGNRKSYNNEGLKPFEINEWPLKTIIKSLIPFGLKHQRKGVYGRRIWRVYPLQIRTVAMEEITYFMQSPYVGICFEELDEP